MTRRLILLLALFAATPLSAQDRPADPLPPDFDAWVARVMTRFGIPGVAVTVVQDGRVVLAKGYGVKTLGRPEPVTPRTTFAIASNTKAFTATALGLLVEDGKLGWDDKVIQHLPWFRLSHPYVTAELTIRDLLTHRSGLGLGAGDLLIWPGTDLDRTELVRRLRHVPLATSFRAQYAYDNVLYLVAGEVVAAASGMSWEAFVQQRLLTPLGMRDATMLTGGALPAQAATPHAEVEGKVRPVEATNTMNTNPAGGIVASAEDMAPWLIAQVDSGRMRDGTRLFPPRLTRQLWQMVTPIAPGGVAPSLAPMRATFNGYALGFTIRDWRGRQLLTHTGGLAGFVSRVAILPAQRLAVSVLTNAESGAGRDAIAWAIIDRAVGGTHDWLAGFDAADRASRAAGSVDPDVPTVPRDSTRPPSLPLARYAGDFEDAWYGRVAVTVESGKLVMRFRHTPALVGELTPWGGETFVVRWRDRSLRADAYVTYDLAPGGVVREVRMAAVSPAVDFSYDFHDLLLKPVARR